MANHEEAIARAIRNEDAAGVLKAYDAYVTSMKAAGQTPKPASYFGVK